VSHLCGEGGCKCGVGEPHRPGELKFSPALAELREQLTSNPKDKIGLTKVPLSLVPPVAIAHEALAMADGARKYGAYNWRKNKVRADIYVDAAMRHITAWNEGEERASDSKMHHLGHARACLGILLDALEGGNLIDNRPLPGPLPYVLQRETKTTETAKGAADLAEAVEKAILQPLHRLGME
jgi:hypothetical protein